MSEYWVSKKKYFCKYCDIYIADDAPSRQQHENGLRHKGNVERFIRNLYKTGEKRKKDLEDERRDIARLELAAQAAFAHDVASGVARPTSAPIPSTSAAPPKPLPKPSNPYANYSTAQSLGFQDPDAERYAAEAERRRTQGVIGEWEVVSTPSAAPPPLDAASETPEGVPDEAGSLKREAQTPIDDEDGRQFKLRKKTLAGGLGHIYDPGAIPIKLKKEKLEPVTQPAPAPVEPHEVATKSTSVPKWTKIQWKRTGENDASGEGCENAASVAMEQPVDVTCAAPKWSKIQWQTPVDAKPDTSASSSSLNPAIETEDQTELPTPLALEEAKADIIKSEGVASPQALTISESTGGMFRKRKLPVGRSGGKRQP